MKIEELQALAYKPITFSDNRIERLYMGGKLLNRWQGHPSCEETSWAEEYLVMTTRYIGPADDQTDGISRVTLSDGTQMPLPELLDVAPQLFLGEPYAKASNNHLWIEARAGDSNCRLVLQCHPAAKQAKEFFGMECGKTEAWYILDVQPDNQDPHLYAGLKEGVSKEMWVQGIEDMDAERLLSYMHRVSIKKGDCIVIPASMPHAMGAGVFFLEIHEPCDLTVRAEPNYGGRLLTQEQMHLGIGYEKMYECYDYTTYTPDDLRKKVVMFPEQMMVSAQGEIVALVTEKESPVMRISLIHVHSHQEGVVLPTFEHHYLVVATKHDLILRTGNEDTLLKQGYGALIPAGVDTLCVLGDGELLAAYPGQFPDIKQ